MSNATSANSRRRSVLARLLRDQNGASSIEFAIIFVLLLLLTLGTVEVGYIFFQWNSGEKATLQAARLAAVTTPVAVDLSQYGSQPVSSGSDWGQSCTKADGSAHPDCYYATVVCGAGANGTCDATAFNTLLAKVQEILPQTTAANLQVSYAFSGLGFIGRPGGQPALITVRLVNMNYDTFFLDAFAGLPNLIPMPAFTASLIGEDQAAN